MNTIMILALTMLLALTFAMAFMMYKTAHPKRSAWLDSGIDGVKTIDDLPWEYEHLTLMGHGNVTIRGWIVKAPEMSSSATSPKPPKTFILIHGHKKNKVQMLGRGKLLRDLGYNLVFIDFRHHGDSDDGPFGLGYFGRFDLKILIKEIKKNIFPESSIGVFGISLGATTALATEAAFGCIDCIIADSPSSNQTMTLCEYGKRLYHTPFSLTKAGLFVMEKYYDMNFDELNTPELIKNTRGIKDKGWKNIPVLLLHGVKDNRVPFYHSEKLYEAITSFNNNQSLDSTESPIIKLVKFSNANHVQGYSFEKERYEREVRDFLTHWE